MAIKTLQGSVSHGGVFFKRFSHLSGPNGAGATEMNVAGSGGNPSFFWITPGGENHRILLSRVNFLIHDDNCSIGKFGGITALVSGVTITMHDADGVEVVDFLDGDTIKANEEFNLLAGIDVAGIDNTKAVDAVPIRWTLEKGLNGKPLMIPPGYSIRIGIYSDLTALTHFRAMAQGTTYSGLNTGAYVPVI